MIDSVIIHTDEIALKGNNRTLFERQLRDNARRRLGEFPDLKIGFRKGLMLLQSDRDLTPEINRLRTALSEVFGISNFTFAQSCPRQIEEISRMAAQLMTAKSGSFRVTAKRADKSFPLNSVETAGTVGAGVLGANPALHVDLSDPDHTVFVEINVDGAFVATDRQPGPGGLPTGTTGTMVVLLSGGIDSPVAAWKLMRRGCRTIFVHFHSYPHVGRESIDKVRRLAESLDRFQGRSILYTVSIAEAQREITAKTDQALRIIMYRRLMMRLAERLAISEGALGLVTGDSLGQVASQTPENLLTVSAAAKLPIYRPLIGEDKRDIVDLARAIGTYAVSIEPHDDCCSLFVPDHPELRSTPEQAAAEEAKLDYTRLIETALAQTERETLGRQTGTMS
ncbi:tRNA 4-thiouridine(8) synthase ThiI [Candidatus Uhrbacteria bacterium CG_4_10_14_0_8_um_filter_58_22]|uniref:Probable tRNA sulfurtransferase n=1 Tax=Candidatus Uhrbacteria bacterium CG_4_10_14_0_8_um_filter_58_22 TaxID=1975029 RepID=A0A2M7Q9U6_9BACT|nr:MAG: tRNA 4-thiouridine(8) synthase ThiI [Parcubacteria group bacterium CG1_02_58_44]PIY62608.1 MAG: tRNA 4-thiouridine(8) synthase ThiI [Candidatus Uhrbacteria bacterium CG_4_10_14_0_8_um_filter_58_22]